MVHADWHDEAGVWVATSEDVPGLVAESATMESLVAKLDVPVPEMLEANGVDSSKRSVADIESLALR